MQIAMNILHNESFITPVFRLMDLRTLTSRQVKPIQKIWDRQFFIEGLWNATPLFSTSFYRRLEAR